METETAYIAAWRQLAEKNLGWQDSAQWSEYDFDKLSDLIFDKTGDRLSVSTLKRIWGRVRYNSNPSTMTLNVLARFLGHADWRAFRRSSEVIPAATAPAVRIRRTRKKSAPFVLVGLCAVIVCFLVAWALKKGPDTTLKNIAVSFRAMPVTSGMPNSVVFNYDASGYHSDSVYIQQSWDPSRREKVAGDGKQHTSIYYYPGYFNAKLVVNGEVKKEQPLFITTKGWLGIVDKNPSPVYLSDTALRRPGGMGITADLFSKIKGSPVLNDSWVYFCNVREYGALTGNDFLFETSLRNTSTLQQCSCRRMSVEIDGTDNCITIPFSGKGCISALNLYTGFNTIHGRDADLSAFGCEVSSFQHIVCSVANRQLQVTLNGKLIFTTPMPGSIGRLTGICLGFEGAGEVAQVKLGDHRKTVYEDDFQSQRTLTASK